MEFSVIRCPVIFDDAASNYAFPRPILIRMVAPTGFEDFERKAQMLDYASHRVIFEGINTLLWAPNNDTQSSYYGVLTFERPRSRRAMATPFRCM